MSLTRYLTIVLGVVAATLAAAWPAVPADARAGVLLGAALAAINTFLAYAFAVWAIPKRPTVFLAAVLGGMGVRMAVLLGIFMIAVGVFGMAAPPLAVSLLAYFVAFLVFELAVLHRRMSPGVPAR